MRRRLGFAQQICCTPVNRGLTTSRMGVSLGESAHLILVLACSFTAHTTIIDRSKSKSAWESLLDTKEYVRYNKFDEANELFVQKLCPYCSKVTTRNSFRRSRNVSRGTLCESVSG